MRPLLLLFLLFPALELVLLILMGSAVGALPTLAWLLISAALGITVLRRAGWQTWRQADWRMQRGESPVQELTDGALVGLGGVLLAIPGLVTDVAGLLCLLPFTRRWLAGHYRGIPGRPGGAGPVTLEGEFREEREPDAPSVEDKSDPRR